MKKQPIYDFYFFGTCLRFLQDCTEGDDIFGDGNILDNIDRLINFSDRLGLNVTKRVAKDLLDGVVAELKKCSPGDSITLKQSVEISNNISTLRITLDAELAGVDAYTPTPKRLDLVKLLSGVDQLFSPGTFSALPDLAKYDFAEAGKCIAFELPTSAAFHVLRGTECVLRFYYEKMIKQKRIKSRMWGPIVADLRSREKTKKHQALNNHLDNIRTSFRNPTQHPEAVYDIHEVQDLWSVCVDVLNKIYKILKDNDCGKSN